MVDRIDLFYNTVVVAILMAIFVFRMIQTMIRDHASGDLYIGDYVPAMLFIFSCVIGMTSVWIDSHMGVLIAMFLGGMTGLINFILPVKSPKVRSRCKNVKWEKWLSLLCGVYMILLVVAEFI